MSYGVFVVNLLWLALPSFRAFRHACLHPCHCVLCFTLSSCCVNFVPGAILSECSLSLDIHQIFCWRTAFLGFASQGCTAHWNGLLQGFADKSALRSSQHIISQSITSHNHIASHHVTSLYITSHMTAHPSHHIALYRAHITLHHITSHDITAHDITSPHITSSHLISPRNQPHYLTSLHNQPHYLISPRDQPHDIIPHHITRHSIETTGHHQTELVWAAHWLVVLRAFFPQILSLAYRVSSALKLPPSAHPGTTGIFKSTW